MVVLLKNGCDHFKNQAPNGSLINPVWYCYYSKNNLTDQNLINNMVKRLHNSVLYQFTNVLQFYDNQTKVLIAKVNL